MFHTAESFCNVYYNFLAHQTAYCGNSSHIIFDIVHKVFTPTQKEIIFAEKVVREIDEKKAQGIGVFTVDGKMIDIAFYDGAKRTIALAKASGVYEGDL